jgi:hypothetical protein
LVLGGLTACDMIFTQGRGRRFTELAENKSWRDLCGDSLREIYPGIALDKYKDAAERAIAVPVSISAGFRVRCAGK